MDTRHPSSPTLLTDFVEPVAEDPSQGAEVVALTVLCHPDASRIGDRVLLGELASGREAFVSRLRPAFLNPSGPLAPGLGGEPLADLHVSREPLRFQAGEEEGSVLLLVGKSRTRVSVGGEPITSRCLFSAEEVDSGVVLELARRIVLLLHRYTSRQGGSPGRHGLVGDSSAMESVRREIDRIAELKVPVLLRGETGTGKELVARAIHEHGHRDGPFVAVNFGAIPASLASSELFGAAKGSFTGAVQSQVGYFARAEGGTLFLDEIGEASPEVQVMLLRAIETEEIQPVGTQQTRKVDVRLVAATDADLEVRAAAGEFRAPLLHRLAGYEIWLPPLRQRRDDIGRLLSSFLREELAALGATHLLNPPERRQVPWLSAEVVARLGGYDWPGNVRQLRNVVRQLAIGSRDLPKIEIGPPVERLLSGDGSAGLATGPRPVVTSPGPAVESPPPPPPKPKRRKPATVGEAELITALRTHRYDLKATAEALRISRTSLYALIEKFPNVRSPGEVDDQEIFRCYQACEGDLESMVDRLQLSKAVLQRRLGRILQNEG